MKIKSKKDIDTLQETIQKELGIDITHYRNSEVAENLVDLLLFPKYIFKWVARPILLAVVLYIVGFFVIDLVNVQYFLYGIIGFVLFLLTGIFAGLLYLTRKLNEDVSSVTEYSFGVMKSSILDIDNMGGRVNKGNLKDVMGMLFKGVIHVVTIPMVSNAIYKKVPIGGKMVNWMVKNSLVAVSDRVSFDPDKIDENMIDDGDAGGTLMKYANLVDKTNKGLSSTFGNITKFISGPIKFAFYFFLFLLLIFIYVIW